MTTFEKAIAYLFKDEGTEFTNDPDDSGGATKFGITEYDYADFIGKPVSTVQIKDLTLQEAKAFYEERYWHLFNLDKLESPIVAIALFDSGVLYGKGTAAALAQRTLGECGIPIKVDGIIGRVTIDALNAVDPYSFIKCLQEALFHRMNAIVLQNPKNEKYRNGWTRRIERLSTLLT